VENRNNDQCGFDTFFATAVNKRKTGDSSCTIGIASDSSTSTHKIGANLKSGSYEVKKITGSTRFKHGIEETKTGLHAVSIDTDTVGSPNNTHQHRAASIDTDEFTNQMSDGKSGIPVIIDETDMYPEQEKKLRQTSTIKKEKTLQQRSVSVDISSDIRAHELPTVDKMEHLGSGTVDGVLGSGGMACVYKIWNEKLEIYRAVKILLPTMQKEQQDRFMTEAKITAKLHHPNIIETYDSGEWHGLPIIEMELIEGTTLNTFIATHKTIPSPVCASIAIQVARALAYAHTLKVMIYGKNYTGIIHRDLKPSNIMVAHTGQVKLMDFGVARPMETGLHTVVTENIVGTIHYFSPEQIGGYPIDHLTDVYSFGAVLYELLSGRNPFPYSNMVAMIQAKTKNQFRRLEDFPMEMDQRIASVAQTCLRTDKRERYANFESITSVLNEIQSSYAMGSPEEVMTEFCRNPQNVLHAYQQYSKNNSENTVQQTSAPQPINPQNEDGNKSVAGEHTDETWEPKHLSKTIIIGAAGFLCILLLIGIFLLVQVKSGKPLLFNHLINNAMIQNAIHATPSNNK
jgi:serine/threonine protein kinase